MFKLVIILCFIVLWACDISAKDCPEPGIKGYAQSFPKFLTNNEGQKVGYHAVIQISTQVQSEGSTILMVEDEFDGSNGKLKVKSSEGESLAFYYHSNHEAFIIADGLCEILNLSDGSINVERIVRMWSPVDLSEISDVTDSFGPVGLFINFISSQQDLQLVKLNDGPTGFDANSIVNQSIHWFTCLPGNETSIDVFLDSKRKLTSIVLNDMNGTRISFTFVKFHPLPIDQQRSVAYPYGHGCGKGFSSDFMVPTFAISRSFWLQMEVALHYDAEPVATFLDTLSILKYEGVYSYETWYNNKKVTVVYDSDLEIEYLINQDDGTCLTQKAMPINSGFLKWPYSNDDSFNILSPLVLQLQNDDMKYFGQMRTESNDLLDIYERKINSYAITDGQYRSALINYFVPVSSKTPYPTPSKIDIQLENFPPKPKSITRIKLKIVEYMESDDVYDPIRFDLRNCHNEFGQSIWFQIVFNIVPPYVLKDNGRNKILVPEFRKLLNFIPTNRLTDVQVGIRGSSLYITSKLTDGPSILYAYDSSPNAILRDPSTGMIRDNDEDCARLCTGTIDCKGFSYCDDRKCTLYTGPLPVPTDQTSRCTVYTFKLDNDSRNSSESKVNQFIGSSFLVNQIKLMVDARKFALPSIGTADLMFVVSSPYEIGGYGDAYEHDHSAMSKLNDYKLLMPGYEIVNSKRNTRVTGLGYLDCLYKCENDNDCVTVSYCTDGKGVCTVSSKSAEMVKLNDELRSLKTSCDILSKTFLDFFNRLPGRSLAMDTSKVSPRKLVNLDRETCAKACLDEQSFTCEAFDFCESDKKSSFDCYLRVFHIFGNVSVGSYTWDLSNTRCNHYTRKLSMDYKQFVGMKLKEGPVIVTIEDNSLENCAAACNQAEEGCNSFEYCQPIDLRSTKSSCRLTSHQVIDEIGNMTSDSSCSVYGIVRKDQVNRVYLLRGRVSIPLAVLAGLTAFVFGVLLSAAITYCSMNRKKY